MIPEESSNPLSKEPTPEEVIVIFHPMITKAAKNFFNSTSLPFVYRYRSCHENSTMSHPHG